LFGLFYLFANLFCSRFLKPPLDVFNRLPVPGFDAVVCLMVFARLLEPDSVSRPVKPPLLFWLICAHLFDKFLFISEMDVFKAF